jgi:UDP-N-acetyl-D-glucosamine dehydrogenase
MGKDETRRIGVVGLGYVGLPLAMLFVDKGFDVLGIDLDSRKLDALRAHKSYLSDLTDDQIAELMQGGRFEAVQSYEYVPELDVIVICVPTPLNEFGGPDLTYVQQSVTDIREAGLNGQLIVLESSTYPGTTEEILLPLLSRRGAKVGQEFHLAYSPERVNPGDTRYARTAMPKIVSGVTERCLDKIVAFYSVVFDQVVPVSSTRTAEMAKVMENSQRFINISFVNEMARLCEAMKIDIWEVIDAIHTKPYGNLYFYPGPSVGGHCIPVDPLYLSWKAKQEEMSCDFITLAKRTNDSISESIAAQLAEALVSGSRLDGKRILLVGATYKKDVNDVRESGAMELLHCLKRHGAYVDYHDPLIPEISMKGEEAMVSVGLDEGNLASYDAVVLATDHTGLPVAYILEHSKLVYDTRNMTRGISGKARVIRLGTGV